MLADTLPIKDLTDQERLMFHAEFNSSQKSPTTGLLLCLFLGGVGAHRFYLNQVGWVLCICCFVGP